MASDIRITVENVFQAACDLAPEERASYLERACNGNAALRREVEELLSFDESGGTFLEKPALQDAARGLAADLARNLPSADSDTMREEEWSLGPYRIRYQIGKGGMGIVYLAVDTRDDRQVAIKVLPRDYDTDEDRVARFTREGRLLSTLRHPNIAEIYEQTEYDGKPCIALEYVPGDTLADRLRQGPLPVREALQYALQIAAALEAAHDQRIVHRDLKPANIKITPEGQVKVLDFGLAKHFQSDDLNTRSASLTESGMMLGTPAYMSPEQWNSRHADHRTDIWAFGCLLYEMLSGQAPFAGKDRASTMRAVFAASPDWSALPKETPLAIQDLIRRCFEKKTASRLSDAGEARGVISEAIGKNRFALSLFLKSLTWVLGHKTKVGLVTTGILLGLALAWQYTVFKNWVQAAVGTSIVITDKDDLTTILAREAKGIDLDLIRAALMPEQQSSSDLLAQNESLLKNQFSSEFIKEIIQTLNEQLKEEKDTKKLAQLNAILAQAHLFNFYLSSKTEDKDAAVKACQKARDLNPESPEIQIVLGELFNAIDSPDQAIAMLEKAHQDKQYLNDPRVLCDLARAYELKQDRDEQAEKFYDTAIAECESSSSGRCARYYNELGAFYFFGGEYEKAIVNWRKVTEQDQFNPFGYSNLGIALLYEGCVDKAIDICTKSLNIKATVDGYSNRGMAYLFQGKTSEAVRDFESVVINGQDIFDKNRIGDIWGFLGDAYRLDGRVEQAIWAYRKAMEFSDSHLSLSPDDPMVVAMKAEWIAKLNSLNIRDVRQDPENMIKQVLRSYPGCTECWGVAILVYHFSGNRNMALQTALEAARNGYSPFVLSQNPEVKELKQEKEFRAISQSIRSKC